MLMTFMNATEQMKNGMASLGSLFELCPNYIAGFCPKGPNCKQKHLKSVVIDEQTSLKQLANFPDSENWAV